MGWYCLLEALARMNWDLRWSSWSWWRLSADFLGVSVTSGRTCYWPHWRLLGLGDVRVDLMNESVDTGKLFLCECKLCAKLEAQCCDVPGYEHAHRYPMWSDQRRFACDGLSFNGEVAKWKERTSTSTCRKWTSMTNIRECTQLPCRWKKKLSRPLVCTLYGSWFDLRLLRFVETFVQRGQTEPIT